MYSHIEPIIAYEDAVNMGCFENFNYTNSVSKKQYNFQNMYYI